MIDQVLYLHTELTVGIAYVLTSGFHYLDHRSLVYLLPKFELREANFSLAMYELRISGI